MESIITRRGFLGRSLGVFGAATVGLGTFFMGSRGRRRPPSSPPPGDGKTITVWVDGQKLHVRNLEINYVNQFDPPWVNVETDDGFPGDDEVLLAFS